MEILVKTILCRGEWERLRDKVDYIIAEIDSSDFSKPTHQMCQFLVAGEDHRFRHHPGVDYIALCRAIWKTVFCGCRQGRIDNCDAIRADRDGALRADMAPQATRNDSRGSLTRHIGRERLPALYLWVSYYGWRMNGFKQACLRVRLDPLLVSEFESAMLVARLKYPEPFSLSRERIRKNSMSRSPSDIAEEFQEKNRSLNPMYSDGTI